ncbi:hypothetical protein DUT67_13995 [Pectobacterium peruviense]|uniref:hypothetical protein n=1 Tax=Pectobacterium peruviense TaxID=2066479 RepID=UPI000DE50024|nr:hypothetical protein [Pectobacterium peruviense]
MSMSFPISLDEWNAALINAVFFEPSRAGVFLSRIDTTGRIFEQLAGSRSKEEAKQSFLDSFGKEERKIQRYLRDDLTLDSLTQIKGIPPHFSILYLTLLAASADNETHDEGDFRVRFSVLLGLNRNKKFIFRDLPSLWRRVEQWSQSKQGCSRLFLPDPQSEKLIGYSKRLSFPCYRDEVRLRAILIRNNLDSYSTFESVNQVIHQRIDGFSEVFVSEFNEFYTLLSTAAMQQAYSSPFWGAVRDITRHEENQQARENGFFCIHLDATDPQLPEIYLLMDDVGAQILDTDKTESLPEKLESYSCIYSQTNVNATLTSLLSFLQKRKKGLTGSRVGMALQAGCLPLFRDDSGYISSDGHHLDDGLVCLIIRREYVEHIHTMFKHIGLNVKTLGINTDSDDWEVIVFDAMSRQELTDLAKLLPSAARRFMVQSWIPARPYITGAARFGQSILLNPASTPIIHMAGAIGGEYVIRDSDHIELISGILTSTQDGEGLFISPEKLTSLSGQASCRYQLTLEEQVEPLVFDIHVLDHAPDAPYRKVAEQHDWLIDGQRGTLVPLNDVQSMEYLKKQKTTSLDGSWSLWRCDERVPVECTQVDLHMLPAAFDWLAEALALRFQKRSTLPFDELNKHITPVSLVTGIPAWQLRRLLFASGWLCVIERRHAPYPVVSLSKRTLSVCETVRGITARVGGMLTKSERHRLQGLLKESERVKRWSTADNDFALGSIELILSGTDRVKELLERFDWQFLVRDDFSVGPLSGVLLPMTQIKQVPTLPPDIYVALWQTKNNQWSEEIQPTNSDLLMRCREKQRNRYFIRADTGYWQTDSFAWALMTHVIRMEKTLGTQSHYGDLFWSKTLITLPISVTQWWLHFAGGCCTVSDDGRIIFAGRGDELWGGVECDDNAVLPVNRAVTRRARALALRRISSIN